MSTRLTPEQVAEARGRKRDDHVIVNLMEDYNMTYLAVWRLLKGKTYTKYDIGDTHIPPQSVEKVPKLNIAQIHEITSTEDYWGKQTYFANKFGVSRTTIQRILAAYDMYRVMK